jgi:hypothetical protein
MCWWPGRSGGGGGDTRTQRRGDHLQRQLRLGRELDIGGDTGGRTPARSVTQDRGR